jgi:hypothetical protein
VYHEGLLNNGGIMNVFLLLSLYGGNYFALYNRCCTVLSKKQPLIPLHEKLGSPCSKCGYCGNEGNPLKNISLLLQVIVWLPYRLFHECIWLHLLGLLKKIMFVPEKGTIMIRQ